MRTGKEDAAQAAMAPHGAALLAYWEGDRSASLEMRRDDGFSVQLPVSVFFREPADFYPTERVAIEHCLGPVLDVGAGTGLHSLVLQERGISVTGIDVSPQAVQVMALRGIRNARCANVFDFEGGPFRTVLLLGHGLGMAETIEGLDALLTHLRALVSRDGQVLADSLDVRNTLEPAHVAYQQANANAGRYIGEQRLQFAFREIVGPWGGWLHVDPETLTERARRSGWSCEVLQADGEGNYLAKLKQELNDRGHR